VDLFQFDSSATGTNAVTDFKLGNDHFQLLEGVTVASLTNTAAGIDLTLSSGWPRNLQRRACERLARIALI
jgi:hypothetical protein